MPGGSYQKPGNWRTLKRRILERDGYRCLCGARAVTADHIIGVAQWVARRLPGSPHVESNLRAICQPCHDEKSKAEAAAGRRAAAARRAAGRSGYVEAHPGRIPPGG